MPSSLSIFDELATDTLVSRDEAIIYSSYIYMNYDVRIRDGGYEFIDIYLPREPTYRKLYWGQGLGEFECPDAKDGGGIDS